MKMVQEPMSHKESFSRKVHVKAKQSYAVFLLSKNQ